MKRSLTALLGITAAITFAAAPSDAKFVTYRDFGAKGDGKTDDFEPIVKAHRYANEKTSRSAPTTMPPTTSAATTSPRKSRPTPTGARPGSSSTTPRSKIAVRISSPSRPSSKASPRRA